MLTAGQMPIANNRGEPDLRRLPLYGWCRVCQSEVGRENMWVAFGTHRTHRWVAYWNCCTDCAKTRADAIAKFRKIIK